MTARTRSGGSPCAVSCLRSGGLAEVRRPVVCGVELRLTLRSKRELMLNDARCRLVAACATPAVRRSVPPACRAAFGLASPGSRPRNSVAVQQNRGDHAAGRPSLPLGALHAGLAAAGAREGARRSPADALILDLEDAVAPGREAATPASWSPRRSRPAATAGASCSIRDQRPRHRVGRGRPGPRRAAGPDAILLPEGRDRPRDVDRRGRAARARTARPGARRLWAMMETPRGILNAARDRRRRTRGSRASSSAPTTSSRISAPRTRRTGTPLVASLVALPARGARRGADLRRRRLQRLPGRRGAARRLRPGPGHGLRRQDPDPPRPARDRQRGLRALAPTTSRWPRRRSPPSRRPRPAARASRW